MATNTSPRRNVSVEGKIVNVRQISPNYYEMQVNPFDNKEPVKLSFGPINEFVANAYRGKTVRATYLRNTTVLVGLGEIEEPVKVVPPTE